MSRMVGGTGTGVESAVTKVRVASIVVDPGVLKIAFFKSIVNNPVLPKLNLTG